MSHCPSDHESDPLSNSLAEPFSGVARVAGSDARTTLMVKNIPNKYTQKMLLATIDEHFRGTYDFFYLPIDFKVLGHFLCSAL